MPTNKFKKGMKKPPNAGRAKGTRNRRTAILKDAILTAATLVGQDGKGKDGLVGYLKMLAVREKAVYARLLEKVLPMQLHIEEKQNRPMSAAEAVQRLKDRNLPVPPSLTLLASPLMSITSPLEQATTVAAVLNDQHEDGETDDLDNRRGSDDDDDNNEFMQPTFDDDYRGDNED